MPLGIHKKLIPSKHFFVRQFIIHVHKSHLIYSVCKGIQFGHQEVRDLRLPSPSRPTPCCGYPMRAAGSESILIYFPRLHSHFTILLQDIRAMPINNKIQNSIARLGILEYIESGWNIKYNPWLFIDIWTNYYIVWIHAL